MFKRKRSHKKIEKLLQETSSACLFPPALYDVSTKWWDPTGYFILFFYIYFGENKLIIWRCLPDVSIVIGTHQDYVSVVYID